MTSLLVTTRFNDASNYDESISSNNQKSDDPEKVAHKYRRDGVVVRDSALQSVDLGFIPLVESYRKTLKNGIYSFPAWRSEFMGGCGEEAGKLACCVLGQGT